MCTHNHCCMCCCVIDFEVMLTLDGQLIANNSIVNLADICNDNSDGLLCSSGLFQARWYFPDGSVVPRDSGQAFFTDSRIGVGAYLVCNSSAQTLPTGLFLCEVFDSFNVYVGVHDENHGKSLYCVYYYYICSIASWYLGRGTCIVIGRVCLKYK